MSVLSASAVSTAGAPFRVGSALSRSFSVFGRGFVKFIILGAIPLLPSLGDSVAISLGLVSNHLTPNAGQVFRQLGASMLAMVLFALSTAACLSGAYHAMRGQPFSVGQSLRDGFRRFFPLVGVAIVSTLLTWLATLALLVPGAMVGCALYVAVPACVIERAGVRASLRRSRDLTRGSRWAIFGLLLLVLLLAALVSGGMTAGTLALEGPQNFARLAAGGLTPYRIVAFLLDAVVRTFGAVVTAVVYYDLRVAKEGVDLDQIAAVFD